MLSADSHNNVVLLAAIIIGKTPVTLDETFKKHRTSKVYKFFDVKLLDEALYSGIDKMFKHGNTALKLLALNLVNKFIFDKDVDPGKEHSAIDIEFSSIKREDSEGDSSKLAELKKKCLFHFYKAMSTESQDIRLKAIEKVSIEPSNTDQNYSILIERLRDQDFGVRLEMIRKLKESKVHFSRLGAEDIYQAMSYCMVTRDTGGLCSPRREGRVRGVYPPADLAAKG